jgi:prefoldin subunit 5
VGDIVGHDKGELFVREPTLEEQIVILKQKIEGLEKEIEKMWNILKLHQKLRRLRYYSD